MALENALVQHLEDSAGVGALAADRIYPRKAPQKPTFPFLIYTVDGSANHTYHHGGPSGLAMATIGITAVATSYKSMHQLAEAVRNLLQGLHGTLGSGGGDDEESDVAIFLRNQLDTDGKVGEGSDLVIYSRTLDFDVWHHEVVP